MRSSAFNAPVSGVARSAVRSSEVNMFFSGPVTGIQVPPGNAPPRSKAPVAKKAPVRKAAAKKAPAKKAAPAKKNFFGK